MSDIVERLRLQNWRLLGTGHDFSDVLLDAANEIERLRKAMYFDPSIFSLVSKELLTEKETEIELLREQLGLGATGAKALADAKEEIARLRAALVEVDEVRTEVEDEIETLRSEVTKYKARLQLLRQWGYSERQWYVTCQNHAEAYDWFDQDGVPI